MFTKNKTEGYFQCFKDSFNVLKAKFRGIQCPKAHLPNTNELSLPLTSVSTVSISQAPQEIKKKEEEEKGEGVSWRDMGGMREKKERETQFSGWEAEGNR